MNRIFLLYLTLSSSLMASYKFTILFNNIPHDSSCSTAWGFSCYVEGPGINILFDTGCDGDILMNNMQKLNVDADKIDFIVISHMHYDHIGGLEKILSCINKIKLYLPAAAQHEIVHELETRGIDVTLVKDPLKIAENIYSTGELNDQHVPEQSLVIDTRNGLVVMTGCAHPGIVRILEKVRETHNKKIYLVFGGFHMANMGDTMIQDIINRIQEMQVEKIAPSHCTGETAIEAFRKAWVDDFIDLGCGATFEIE